MRQTNDDGSTLMIEIDNKSAGIIYKTADTFAIFPINEDSLVEQLATSQGWRLTKNLGILKLKNWKTRFVIKWKNTKKILTTIT